MSTEADPPRTTIEALARKSRSHAIPISDKFAYYPAIPVPEEDLRQYLNDPIAALPPAIVEALPKMGVLLAPYLEKSNGKSGVTVAYERPSEARHLSCVLRETGELTLLALGIKDIEVADYHYQFYSAIASLVAGEWPQEIQERFYRTIREELSGEVHGEIDEKSWHLKQALLRRQTNVRKETKLFRDYARQAFEDTLTLYLHGTCCDIDVETGPRQMASRYIRRRLDLLYSLYPPPEGYAVLPEHLKPH
jgi:hypothetical protein